MMRHHPQWLEARKIVESGQIGALTTVQSIFTYYNADPNNVRNKKDIGGGGLLDIGCYCIVAPRFVTAKEPVRVISLMDKDPKFGTDRLYRGCWISEAACRQVLFAAPSRCGPARPHSGNRRPH